MIIEDHNKHLTRAKCGDQGPPKLVNASPRIIVYTIKIIVITSAKHYQEWHAWGRQYSNPLKQTYKFIADLTINFP